LPPQVLEYAFDICRQALEQELVVHHCQFRFAFRRCSARLQDRRVSGHVDRARCARGHGQVPLHVQVRERADVHPLCVADAGEWRDVAVILEHAGVRVEGAVLLLNRGAHRIQHRRIGGSNAAAHAIPEREAMLIARHRALHLERLTDVGRQIQAEMPLEHQVRGYFAVFGDRAGFREARESRTILRPVLWQGCREVCATRVRFSRTESTSSARQRIVCAWTDDRLR
jgi:hypothetical protein